MRRRRGVSAAPKNSAGHRHVGRHAEGEGPPDPGSVRYEAAGVPA